MKYATKDIEGLLRITNTRKLLEERQLRVQDGLPSTYRKSVVMVFASRGNADEFGKGFVKSYLIPKYGDKARSFPIRLMEVYEEYRSPWSDIIPGSRQEKIRTASLEEKGRVWLFIPKERFSEVERYFRIRNKKGKARTA